RRRDRRVAARGRREGGPETAHARVRRRDEVDEAVEERLGVARRGDRAAFGARGERLLALRPGERELERGEQQRALGAVRLDRLQRDARALGDAREGRALVAAVGELLGRGAHDALAPPGGLLGAEVGRVRTGDHY